MKGYGVPPVGGATVKLPVVVARVRRIRGKTTGKGSVEHGVGRCAVFVVVSGIRRAKAGNAVSGEDADKIEFVGSGGSDGIVEVKGVISDKGCWSRLRKENAGAVDAGIGFEQQRATATGGVVGVKYVNRGINEIGVEGFSCPAGIHEIGDVEGGGFRG